MDVFRIEGGRRLSGRVSIEGSKNATLPLMAASVLTDQPLVLRNIPDLSDIHNMSKLLAELGVRVGFAGADSGVRGGLAGAQPAASGGEMVLQSEDENRIQARYDIVR